MVLAKQTIWRMQIDEWAVISVQRVVQYVDDGELASERNHRFVLTPGSSTSAAPQLIQDVAALIWTPARIAAWQAHIAEVSG